MLIKSYTGIKADMSDEEKTDLNFSHYTPQHPLPEEIKKLARDDTVCKYCGVSYLIHNEIKALEDKMKVLEKELATLRGQEQREVLLKQENSLLIQQKQELQETVGANSKLIQSLNEEIKQQKENVSKADEDKKTYKNMYMSTLRQFSMLSQTVRQQRQGLNDLKEGVTTNKMQILQCIQSALQNVQSIKETSIQESENLESKIQCLDMEKLVLTQSNKTLTDSLKQKEADLLKMEEDLKAKSHIISNLEGNMLNAEHLSGSLKSLETNLNDVKAQLENEKTQGRTLSVELDQYKIQLRSKNSELSDAVKQNKELEKGHEIALQKLRLELHGKEGEAMAAQKQLKSLENQIRELQQKENQITQQSKLSLNEVDDLKGALQRAKGDNEALKAERELMIQAHQNRIEDLRESFKKKMAETENWPQKLQAAVAAEKTRGMAELKNLEENLKHSFVLELQIEKDKYNELLKKCQDQEKDKNNVKDKELALLEQKYRQEVAELRRQVEESKRREQEREEELLREIASLKNIIKDLQDRLARLDSEDSGQVSELKEELSKTHGQLTEAQSELQLMEGKVKEAKDEAQFLQNIVRKECEERFELTEALSDARKELLQLKKPAGGYMSKRGSVSSLHSGNSSNPGTPGPSGPPGPPGPLQPLDEPTLKLRSQMPTNSINLSYSGRNSNNSNNSVGSGGGNGGSRQNRDAMVLESRKRIATMLGRPS